MLRITVLTIPAMRYARRPPDKNKRIRSFRSSTLSLHPIRYEIHLSLLPFLVGTKKWYQLQINR